MNNQLLISQLESILDKNRVLIDDESKNLYGRDLTQAHTTNPLAIVFPINTAEVLEIVRLSNKTNTSLVPSGGRTGYSGGAVAINNEVVVSFEKMNRVIHFNKQDCSIKCEAGVTLKTIHDFSQNFNLLYPVDFASSKTCQIGGNIATNAGGIKVFRYGSTRNWVLGLQVVTGKGDVLELNYGLIKNSTGYDFRHLFIGSEGTLGFITEATLKLTPFPSSTKVVLFSVYDKNHFIEILNIFNAEINVTAFEFFSELALQHVISNTDFAHPFSTNMPFYGLLEYESDDYSDQLIIETASKLKDEKIIRDVLISENEEQAKIFWRYRTEISMSLLKYSPFKFDVAVLPSMIPDFVKDAENIFNEMHPGFEIIWFGHIGDGNLHLNILKPKNISADQFFQFCEQSSVEIYSLIQKYQGSVSAEHGIGLLKRDFLRFSKNDIEINYMQEVKKIFDPNNIMNPGKLL